MRQIRAVIFDLDGLLVDSEPVWFRVRTKMFARFGMTWTDDDQRALMGRNTQSWIDYVYETLRGRLSKKEVEAETLEGMISSYRNREVRIMPGADAALEYTSKNFIVGLASGSPQVLIDAALQANNWTRFFSTILSSDEVSLGKPSPDVYLEAMRRLRIGPDASVVVEDSGSGILAGKAAGAAVIAVPNEDLMPPRDALDKADAVLESLESFPRAMRTLNS